MSDTTAPRASLAANGKAKRSNRRKFYAVHSWLGFHLALVTALILCSGTIATVANEIDWIFQSDMRVTPDGEKATWGAMERAVEAYAPRSTIETIMEMEGDHFAYRAVVIDEYGREMFVHVNQWTGEVTGETHPLTVQRFFRDLHRFLFMPKNLGIPIVTSLAFVLATSLVTGLKTARNWGRLMLRVRTDKGKRIMWGDAHKAAGLWGIWFFAVIIVTGLWYLFEFSVVLANPESELDNPKPKLTAERVAEFGAIIQDRSLDDVVTAALGAYPDLKVSAVQFPIKPNAPFAVQGKVGNPMIRTRANVVYLDPVSLDVLQVKTWRSSPPLVKLNEMADPLHFGDFAGLPTKLIWCVFGVAMTGLSLTGVWLTWKRVQSSTISKAQFATMPVLLLSMFFFTKWYDKYQGPDKSHTERLIAQASSGLLMLELWEGLGPNGIPNGRLRGQLASPVGRPIINGVQLNQTQSLDVMAQGSTVGVYVATDELCAQDSKAAAFAASLFTGAVETFVLPIRSICASASAAS